MSQIQVLDSHLSYQLLGQKTSVKLQSPSPSALPAPEPSLRLHPWLQTSVLGTALGTLGGAGMAAAVSQFLDEPIKGIHHARIGGLQGFFAGASGALVASFAPDQTTGTVVAALVGAGSGAIQALAITPSKGKIVMATLTGLVAGAAAGHVSLAVREHLQTVRAAAAP